MIMKKFRYSYKQMLLIYLGAVLGIFVLVASIYEIRIEKNYKKSILTTKMEGIADLAKQAISFYGEPIDGPKIYSLLPNDQEIRLTILTCEGNVIYDSDTQDIDSNHSDRPEIIGCRNGQSGWAIRTSETNHREYCYLAKTYEDCMIRIALPYELDIKHFLRPNTFHLLISVVLLLAVLVAIGMAMLQNYKQLEEALTKVENEKKENRRMKHEMTHNIAHELRTPVSSMRSYLEALVDCEDLDGERQKLFIQRAYLQSLRLSDLLRDISIVTKIEEAPELIKVEELCLKDILSGVLDEFSAKIQERGMEAVNLIGDDSRIKGSPSLVYAIFRNLVENSCKYAGKDTMITVRSEKTEDGMIRVMYKDSGKGVNPAMLERIFERFFRIDAATGSDYRDDVGSGLGLSVVRNAVQFHGGQISANIPPEGGLEFDFTLNQRRKRL